MTRLRHRRYPGAGFDIFRAVPSYMAINHNPSRVGNVKSDEL